MSSWIKGITVETFYSIDPEDRLIANKIVEKQSKCNSIYGYCKTLGKGHLLNLRCKLHSCTHCYNKRLLDLQRDVLISIKASINNETIFNELDDFLENGGNKPLITWCKEHESILSIPLDSFRALSVNISPKNVQANLVKLSLDTLKTQVGTLYSQINSAIGLFSILDFKADKSNTEINTHLHSVVLLDANCIFKEQGKLLRYSTDETIDKILQKNGIHAQNLSKWIKTYYDLFKVIAYITKPREKDFDSFVDPLLFLKCTVSLYNKNGEIGQYRPYIFKGELKEQRAKNNKIIKTEKLIKEMQTPMKEKEDDYIQYGNYIEHRYHQKLLKEMLYSFNEIGKIIICEDTTQNIYNLVALYKKHPVRFQQYTKNLENIRFEELASKIEIPLSKIKQIIITPVEEKDKILYFKPKKGKKKGGFKRVVCRS